MIRIYVYIICQDRNLGEKRYIVASNLLKEKYVNLFCIIHENSSKFNLFYYLSRKKMGKKIKSNMVKLFDKRNVIPRNPFSICGEGNLSREIRATCDPSEFGTAMLKTVLFLFYLFLYISCIITEIDG